jgi:hypothetical protein
MRVAHCISSVWSVLAVLSVAGATAQSNFDLDHSVVSVESIGVLEWAAPGNGAVINQFYASGHIHGANIGWISLGVGPVDKLQYRNNSAADFGVNVAPDGALRGFAYGANVGWINFEPLGNPRVDWVSGRLSGRAWSANLGWIELENATQFLRIESLPAPEDSDADGMADAWEILHASNLTLFSADSDADSDGLVDSDEYLAGTDPLDDGDALSVHVRLSAAPLGTTLEWPTKAGYLYFIDRRAALSSSADWSPVSEKIVGNGATLTLTIPFADAHTFYRVKAYPPLSAP